MRSLSICQKTCALRTSWQTIMHASLDLQE